MFLSFFFAGQHTWDLKIVGHCKLFFAAADFYQETDFLKTQKKRLVFIARLLCK